MEEGLKFLSLLLLHIKFWCNIPESSFSVQTSIGMNLPELVQPVLTCFEDPDARVRYYACESLYNISKVARGAVLVFFNIIFNGLCKVRLNMVNPLFKVAPKFEAKVASIEMCITLTSPSKTSTV